MRIGIFTDSYLPDINGVVTSVVTLRKALEQLGHTVFIISNHQGAKITMDAEEKILRLPGVELKRLYGYTMSSPINFAHDYIEEMRLDVIHTQQEFGVSLYGRQVAHDLGIPQVYTYHTMYADYTHYINPFDFDRVDKAGKWVVKKFTRLMGNNVQAVIAPSQKTKDVLESYGVRAPIYVVPTGLDLDAFKPEHIEMDDALQLRASLGLKPDDHVLVFVGRLAKEKALEMPIRAVAASRDEKLHLVVVGSGTDEEYFQSIAKSCDAQDRVHFVGKVPRDHIPYYYVAFDGFVSASLSETQGLTYIEALASGLPVFGRRDEVLYDLVEEGKTGYYFDDEAELVKKMDTFFAMGEAERNAQSAACIEKSEPYSKEIFGRKILAVYEQAIDDYSHTFDVEKIRMKDDFVELTVERESDPEPIRLLVPLDDFFELKIALHTKLDAYLITGYLEMQEFYHAYTIIKRKVLSKDMTAYELRQYLRHHFDLEEGKIEQLVQEMKEKHWVDDKKYALEKSAYWHEMGNSKKSITTKLKKVGTASDLIDEALVGLDDSIELANAKALAERVKHTFKMQSSRLKRKNVIHKLVMKGYSVDIANTAIDEIDMEQDDEQACRNALKKAMRLYSALEDEKRVLKVRQYCLRKGFSSGQIDEQLEEMSDQFED